MFLVKIVFVAFTCFGVIKYEFVSGQDDDDISDDAETPPQQKPPVMDNHTFTALIEIVFTNGRRRSCTGTIIHDNVVITAAHCFQDHESNVEPELTASFVIIGTKKMYDTGYENYLPIERIITHPDYKGWTADLALVYTFSGMTSDKPGNAIPLVGENTLTPIDSNVTVLSWGQCKNEVLPMHTHMPMGSERLECESSEELVDNSCEPKSNSFNTAARYVSSFEHDDNEEVHRFGAQDYRQTQGIPALREATLPDYPGLERSLNHRIPLYEYKITRELVDGITERQSHYISSEENKEKRRNRERQRELERDIEREKDAEKVREKQRELERDRDIERGHEQIREKEQKNGAKTFTSRHRYHKTHRNPTNVMNEDSVVVINVEDLTLRSKGHHHHYKKTTRVPTAVGSYELREGSFRKAFANNESVFETSNNTRKEQNKTRKGKVTNLTWQRQMEAKGKTIIGHSRKSDLFSNIPSKSKTNQLTIETFGFVNVQTCKKMVGKALPPLFEINPNNVVCYSAEDHYINDEDSGAPAIRQGHLVAVTIGGVECDGDHIAIGMKMSCFCPWISENLPDGPGKDMKCCKDCCVSSNREEQRYYKHLKHKSKYMMYY